MPLEIDVRPYAEPCDWRMLAASRTRTIGHCPTWRTVTPGRPPGLPLATTDDYLGAAFTRR
jgi:hypothetical protein